ncbi:PIG-L family deacetylase [Sulfurisphaera javensis]|uniref:PIG-L family deacetylase n=1 Tax=Sulfurisphaera javensis TaxID=2049879 RepID=A0AAT9GVB5_9CREN
MRVLVVAPHPDDETLCCGGSIIQYLPNVKVVIVTDGRYGAPTEELRGSEELVRIRKEEALRALGILGVNDVMFLNFEDSKVKEKEKEVKEALSVVLNQYKPDLVFSPIPIDAHPDHSALGKIMLELYPSSYFYLIWVSNLSLSGWDEIKINVSKYKERKIRALEEYKSQLGGFSKDFLARFTGDYEVFYKRVNI